MMKIGIDLEPAALEPITPEDRALRGILHAAESAYEYFKCLEKTGLSGASEKVILSRLEYNLKSGFDIDLSFYDTRQSMTFIKPTIKEKKIYINNSYREEQPPKPRIEKAKRAITRFLIRYIQRAEQDSISDEIARLIKDLKIPKSSTPGFIYVMQREDGIFKLGRTKNIGMRKTAHRVRHKQSFTLIKRFVVPDMYMFEVIALQLTRKYAYKEGDSRELREMTSGQLDEFLALFHLICQQGVDA